MQNANADLNRCRIVPFTPNDQRHENPPSQLLAFTSAHRRHKLYNTDQAQDTSANCESLGLPAARKGISTTTTTDSDNYTPPWLPISDLHPPLSAWSPFSLERLLGHCALHHGLLFQTASPLGNSTGAQRTQDNSKSSRCPSRVAGSSSTTEAATHRVMGGGAASRTSARQLRSLVHR